MVQNDAYEEADSKTKLCRMNLRHFEDNEDPNVIADSLDFL